tara:strand:- start:661 stop:1290 length:630 start_codon:yes stop_codon:yes gene_type:complete
MSREFHVLGNGPSQHLWFETDMKTGDAQNVVCCNMPWRTIPKARLWASIIGDFKMIRPISEGSIQADHMPWVLGNRPKMFCDQNPSFYMKYAYNIREFYLYVPPYARNATDWSAGHLATHYSCRRLQPDVLHMWGFDSLFSSDLSSSSDFMIPSDRGDRNRFRMNNLWRGIWRGLFDEMVNVQFVVHTLKKVDISFKVPDNVSVHFKEK